LWIVARPITRFCTRRSAYLASAERVERICMFMMLAIS